MFVKEYSMVLIPKQSSDLCFCVLSSDFVDSDEGRDKVGNLERNSEVAADCDNVHLI